MNRMFRDAATMLCALFCVLTAQATDYTEYLTTARGFTEVTSTSQILTGDYYYVIASAENTEMIVSVGKYEAKPGWAPEETIAMRYKSTATDPVLDPKNFFIIEKQDAYIGLRSLPYSICMFQTNSGEGYIWVNGFLYEHNMSEWDQLAPTYQNGYWVFMNQKFADENFHLGPWNKVVADGEAIAGNRTNAAGDEAGHYRLFRISKADYESKVRAARVEALGMASPASPMDATWMIKNASFDQGFTGWNIIRDNPDVTATLEDLYETESDGWHTNVSGTDTGWGDTKIADYGMTNKDGVYLYNTYAWWAANLTISQTLTNVPNGIYELSAVLASHDRRIATLSANGNTLASVSTTGAGNGIPASGTVTVTNNQLVIKAASSTDWWSDESTMAYTAERTIGFFKADNFQLTCKTLLTPLPNDETTVLEAGKWYCYEATAAGKYTLTSNKIASFVYNTESDYLNGNEGNLIKSEMGFPAGRIFFMTKTGGATLKVEPASAVSTFTAVTLNVDGLPQKIGLIKINEGGPGSSGTKLISTYLNNQGFDILACEEDFNYHSELTSNMSGYTWGKHRGKVSSLSNNTDGLEFATRNVTASFANESYTAFTKTTSTDGNQYIKKGYRYYTVTLKTGELIDVFITHMDAGDEAATGSRPDQLQQIAKAILSKGNTDRPKIFMGDTNCRWTREDIKANFFDLLTDTYDISDAWVELTRNGDYPIPGTSTISEEVVDKVIYINPKGSGKMKLNALSYTRDAAGYVDSSGNQLGDHAPVVVKFGIGLYEDVDNTVTPVAGDITYDGDLNEEDVQAMVEILLGLDNEEPYKYNHEAADVNGSGSISLADLTKLVEMIRAK